MNVVPRFEDLSEYRRFCDEVIENLAPVGVMEERIAERIAKCYWQLRCADADEAAQRYMAMRAAILRPFINGSSYDGALQREEHIERLEPELAYLDELINCWDEKAGITQKAWDKLNKLSFGQSFLGLGDASPEEQYERLCAIADEQCGILEALEGEEVPFRRARAEAAGSHLHRHQCTLDGRLERCLRQFYQSQDRRQHEVKSRRRPAKSAPVIDVDDKSA